MTGQASSGAIVTGWDLGGPEAVSEFYIAQQGRGDVEPVAFAPSDGAALAGAQLAATSAEILGQLVLWGAVGVGVYALFYLASEGLYVASQTAGEFSR